MQIAAQPILWLLLCVGYLESYVFGSSCLYPPSSSTNSGDANKFCNNVICEGGWTLYMINGATSVAKGRDILRAGTNSNGFSTWYTASFTTETSPKLIGEYKISESLFDSYQFNEPLAYIEGGAANGQWVKIKLKSGNAFSNKEAFGVGTKVPILNLGQCPDSFPFLTRTGPANGRVCHNDKSYAVAGSSPNCESWCTTDTSEEFGCPPAGSKL